MRAELPRVIVVMGVSGSGKSTVGRRVADRIGGRFFDADDFHPPGNVALMARGVPLTDVERRPWLERLRREVIEPGLAGSGGPVVLACSALKRRYRDLLRGGGAPEAEAAGAGALRFVHLEGSFEAILGRMESRSGHFMKADLLRSQFEALEAPAAGEALRVSIEGTIDEVTDRVVAGLRAPAEGEGAAAGGRGAGEFESKHDERP